MKELTLEEQMNRGPEDDAMDEVSLSTFLDWQREHLDRMADDEFNDPFKAGAKWLMEKVRAHESERRKKLPTGEEINSLIRTMLAERDMGTVTTYNASMDALKARIETREED